MYLDECARLALSGLLSEWSYVGAYGGGYRSCGACRKRNDQTRWVSSLNLFFFTIEQSLSKSVVLNIVSYCSDQTFVILLCNNHNLLLLTNTCSRKRLLVFQLNLCLIVNISMLHFTYGYIALAHLIVYVL